MNHMTVDGQDAPWWDDSIWGDCEICDGHGLIFKTNGWVDCEICDGHGLIFKTNGCKGNTEKTFLNPRATDCSQCH